MHLLAGMPYFLETHSLPWLYGRRLHVRPYPLLNQHCSKVGVLCNTAGCNNSFFLCKLVQKVSVLVPVLLQGHSCVVTHVLACHHLMAVFAWDGNTKQINW